MSQTIITGENHGSFEDDHSLLNAELLKHADAVYDRYEDFAQVIGYTNRPPVGSYVDVMVVNTQEPEKEHQTLLMSEQDLQAWQERVLTGAGRFTVRAVRVGQFYDTRDLTIARQAQHLDPLSNPDFDKNRNIRGVVDAIDNPRAGDMISLQDRFGNIRINGTDAFELEQQLLENRDALQIEADLLVIHGVAEQLKTGFLVRYSAFSHSR